MFHRRPASKDEEDTEGVVVAVAVLEGAEDLGAALRRLLLRNSVVE
jgi:hypothetical protein